MSFAVCVDHLTKRYGTFTAVDNISFQVKSGEIFGLLGPNGAGKSTTLECIEGIKSFDHGSIQIFGEKAGHQTVQKHVGVQLQSGSLPANITVAEAMKLFCTWQKVSFRTDLLQTFGLEDTGNKLYYALSTGQKRRLHLALALAHNPPLLILDEPTAGLDVEGRSSLHNELRRLKKEGITIMVASHDMAEVEALCDNIVIVIKGRIAVMGSPMEITAAGNTSSRIIIKTRQDTLLQEHVLTFSQALEKAKQYTTFMTADIMPALTEILDILKKANDVIIDLRVERPTLEERFLQLVEKGEGSRQ